MRAKLRAECGEFHFVWKLMAHTVISALAAYVHLENLLQYYPAAGLGEYMVYSLTNFYYFLALFPFLCLVWTSGRNNEADRYPVLLRYRTRRELLVMRLSAKALFALAALGVHVGALLAWGASLPKEPSFSYAAADNLAGVIVRQVLNLFCYACVILLLHEVLRGIAGKPMLDLLITTMVPVLDLMVAKLEIWPAEGGAPWENIIYRFAAGWTPWGHIAYRLLGTERQGYRFYWGYWLLLLLPLFCIAVWLNDRRDYVFEETRRGN